MTHTPNGVQRRAQTTHGPASPAPLQHLVTTVVRRHAVVPRTVVVVVVAEHNPPLPLMHLPIVGLIQQEQQNLLQCRISLPRAKTRQSTRPKARKPTLPVVEEEVYRSKRPFRQHLHPLSFDPSLPLPILPCQHTRKHGRTSRCGKAAKTDCVRMVDSTS